MQRLRAELRSLHRRLRAKAEQDWEKVGRRIGRGLGQYPAAAGALTVTVQRDAGRAGGLRFRQHRKKLAWARRAHGAYLLRANEPGENPAAWWRWYMRLTQAEAAFRTG